MTNVQETPQENQEVGLTIADLTQMVAIIDVAAKSGAFEGNQLSSVGFTRDKISKFIAHAEKQQEEAAKKQQENGE